MATAMCALGLHLSCPVTTWPCDCTCHEKEEGRPTGAHHPVYQPPRPPALASDPLQTYEPYLTREQAVEPAQQPAAPRLVQIAVRLMYVGAAVTAIGFFLVLVSAGNLKSAIRSQHPRYC
jgi:hypothetical protein